ncbi:hypothetical protein BC332_24773 [Capsicum chinense]|nr:hypothetical protein FXO38_16035 [Capsicum annuum]KAF3679080.1 hypothetical protein FXO37_04037 [Capsicum annuum]PHU08284.1 hypothetical protein BC332_24773 [Capsicum chinense]
MANSLVAMARFDSILAPSPSDYNEVFECWLTLTSKNGCVEGVYKVFSGMGWLDSPCCQVVNEIDRKCWVKIFPSNQNFVDLLKYYCSTNGGAHAPSPFGAI